MGHIMGLKDLYNSKNASPVYFMSVMAKHISPVPQFMSLKEKEVLGWADENDIKTILSEGEYSLKALGTSGTDNITGYKMDIPERVRHCILSTETLRIMATNMILSISRCSRLMETEWIKFH